TQILRRFSAHDIRVEVVEQSRGKRDMNPFTDPRDRGTRDVLFEFLRLLVHLVPDDCSGDTAHDRSDNRSPGGRSRLIPDHGANGAAGARSDDRTLFLLVQGGAGGNREYYGEARDTAACR